MGQTRFALDLDQAPGAIVLLGLSMFPPSVIRRAAVPWLALLAVVGCGDTTDTTVDPAGSGPACTPTPPYGLEVGDRFRGTFAWEGYTANQASSSVIEAASYFDCDGSLGTTAVLFVQVILPCLACQSQATGLASELPADWEARGIRVVMLVALDENRAPATLQTAQAWRDTFGVAFVAVAADPNFTFGAITGGLPIQVVLDPKTMQIAAVESGYSGDYSVLDALARDNAAAAR